MFREFLLKLHGYKASLISALTHRLKREKKYILTENLILNQMLRVMNQ